MKSEERDHARSHLDEILADWRSLLIKQSPRLGWLRAIREVLGMTTTQFSTRLGVSQSRVVAMERAEQTGSLTMKNLARAAKALDCELVYALVPRHSLQAMIDKRINQKATATIGAISHSMMFEDQEVTDATKAAQLEQLIQRMTMNARSDIWEGE